jgi:hypothetical protein
MRAAFRPSGKTRFATDLPLEEDGFELVVPYFMEMFVYTASEPQTGREPQPVLTTDNGRFTMGRARLAPAMISTPVTEPPEGANARPCQPGAMLSGRSFKLRGQSAHNRFGVMPRRAKAAALDLTSAPVPANDKWYRGLTKLTVAGNRRFEATSLQ